jgi:hypothetical protein
LPPSQPVSVMPLTDNMFRHQRAVFRLVVYMHKRNSVVRWAGHVARMGEDRGVHKVLVGHLCGFGGSDRGNSDNKRQKVCDVVQRCGNFKLKWLVSTKCR